MLARQRRVRAALPVGSYLDIKGHLDIKQVLVLPQVPSHLIFGVSQVILQLPDGVLQRQGHSGAHFVAGTSPTGFLLCLSQTHRNCNGNLVHNDTSHQQLGTMKSHANRDEEAGRAPGMTCKCGGGGRIYTLMYFYGFPSAARSVRWEVGENSTQWWSPQSCGPVGDEVAATEGRAGGDGWEFLCFNIIKAGVVA